jgi:sodium transport system permease protein
MIFSIFKKELRDTLRDRRTLLAMIVVPVLVFPVILGLMTTVSKSFSDAEKEKVFKIGIISEDGSNRLTQILDEAPEELGKRELIFINDLSSPHELIKSDSFALIFELESAFDSNESQQKSNEVKIYYEETNLTAKGRAQGYLEFVKNTLVSERMARNNMDMTVLTPLTLEYVNLSSEKELIGKVAGGFLPYLFIIFGFIGCMYPAIDLFTGEKERKTLETILTTPVPRWKFLVGKMGVIVLSGIAAATFALIGLFLSIEVLGFVEDQSLISVVRSVLSLKFILMLYLLLLPLTVFFAGLLVPITVRAKTFKEAQSIITPLNFAVIFPAMIGLIPDIELDIVTAFIPIVNVVLATKELIAETLSFGLLLITFFTMFILAIFSVMLSYKKFESEKNVVA